MDTLHGKKLLILGGAAVHNKVIRAAKELDVYTIVTDYLPDSPAKTLADESWELSIMEVDAIVERCRREQVDGVLNFCIDPGQVPYQRICSRLGLSCYGTAEQFFIMTNKPAFKDFCLHCGLDVIPTYSREEILRGNVEYPLFIKPADSRGSRGQSICMGPEDMEAAIHRAEAESSNGEIVIERYMAGKQDFSMSYFVVDGEPYLIRTCDRYLGKREDGLNKQCIAAVSPSQYSDLYLKSADEKVRVFIQRLGLRFGPIFMQGFVDGNTFRFYDPGLRFPGGEHELFLKAATGVDLMKAMVEFALTGNVSAPTLSRTLYQLNGNHSLQLDLTCRPGVIGAFVGLEEIKQDPALLSVFTRYETKQRVPDTGDVRQRVCEIGMLIGPGLRVRDKVEWVQATVDVRDLKGESMLVSQLDPALLRV